MTRGYVVGVISGSSSAGAGAGGDSSCVCIAFIVIIVVISITAIAIAIAVVVGVDGRVAPSILLHLLLSSRFIQRARKYNRYRIV